MDDMLEEPTDSPGPVAVGTAEQAAATGGVQLRRVDARAFAAVVDELIEIYLAAMAYPRGHQAGRRQLWLQHAERPGFDAHVAVAGAGTDTDTVIGFVYGYRGEVGQWWNTEVRRGLPQPAADFWLADYAELTELHVHPAHQGQRTGERLLQAFLAQRTESRVLLSTPEGENRAWRLYRRTGFVDVLRHHGFTGDPRPFGVLGLVRHDAAAPRPGPDAAGPAGPAVSAG